MLPLLFITYLCLAYLEHKKTFDQQGRLLRVRHFGPLFASLLGLIPQCGFSVIAAGLYVDRAVTLGTLIAALIATSDEAIPLLIATPGHATVLWQVLSIKLILAIGIGYGVDFFTWRHTSVNARPDMVMTNDSCHHDHHGLFREAFIRTLKIYCFIFGLGFLFHAIIHGIGMDQLRLLLLDQSWLQPLLAALFGFIPNCAVSVLLTSLFMSGVLSFGSLIAGLVSNAGMGFIVLMKGERNKKMIIAVALILLFSAWVSGSLLQLLGGAF